MAHIYIIKRAKPAITSFEFATYNDAIAFMRKSEALQPSKPYKRMVSNGAAFNPVWFVTLGGTFRNSKADYIKLDASKPLPFLKIAA